MNPLFQARNAIHVSPADIQDREDVMAQPLQKIRSLGNPVRSNSKYVLPTHNWSSGGVAEVWRRSLHIVSIAAILLCQLFLGEPRVTRSLATMGFGRRVITTIVGFGLATNVLVVLLWLFLQMNKQGTGESKLHPLHVA